MSTESCPCPADSLKDVCCSNVVFTVDTNLNVHSFSQKIKSYPHYQAPKGDKINKTTEQTTIKEKFGSSCFWWEVQFNYSVLLIVLCYCYIVYSFHYLICVWFGNNHTLVCKYNHANKVLKYHRAKMFLHKMIKISISKTTTIFFIPSPLGSWSSTLTGRNHKQQTCFWEMREREREMTGRIRVGLCDCWNPALTDRPY